VHRPLFPALGRTDPQCPLEPLGSLWVRSMPCPAFAADTHRANQRPPQRLGEGSVPEWPMRGLLFPPGIRTIGDPNRYFQRSTPPCLAEQGPKAFSPSFLKPGVGISRKRYHAACGPPFGRLGGLSPQERGRRTRVKGTRSLQRRRSIRFVLMSSRERWSRSIRRSSSIRRNCSFI
jgi:hypothetical protein